MFRQTVAMCLCLALVAGCEKRTDTRSVMFTEDDSEFVVAVLIDLSPSFQSQMTEGGQAYEFLMALLDRYFRERVGTQDQLILAQISGVSDRALMWQGSPMELRKQFPDPKSFSQFLVAKANPAGSCVHDSIVQTVEYVMDEPNVANRKARSALFVLSDMIDSNPNSAASRARAVQAVQSFTEGGGAFGCYFVDQTVLTTWKRDLQKVGVDFSISSEFRRPTLPSFE